MGNILVCGKKKSTTHSSKKLEWANTCYMPIAPAPFVEITPNSHRTNSILPTKPNWLFISPPESSITQKSTSDISSVNSPRPQSININVLDKSKPGLARSASISTCSANSSKPVPVPVKESVNLRLAKIPSVPTKFAPASLKTSANSSKPVPIPVKESVNLRLAKITSVPTKFAPASLKTSDPLPPPRDTLTSQSQNTILRASSITQKSISDISSLNSPRPQSINSNVLAKSKTGLARSMSVTTWTASSSKSVSVNCRLAKITSVPTKFTPASLKTSAPVPSPRDTSISQSQNTILRTNPYWLCISPPEPVRSSVAKKPVSEYVALRLARTTSLNPTSICAPPISNSSVQSRIESNYSRQPKVFFAQYWPSREMRTLFNNNFKNLNTTRKNGSRLNQLNQELKSNSSPTENNYLDMLWLFADIEDLYCEEAIRIYDRKSEKIENSGKHLNYIIHVPNLIDSRPTISVCSRLTINPSQLTNKIYGTISDIQPDCIVVEFKKTLDLNIQYDVNFLSNRTTFRMEKLAIELMRKKNLVPFMFPNQNKVRSSSVPHTTENFTWYNESVANNIEQQTAIENIYNGTSYPYPYILFGPPGTGKTTTLVESILQLWKNKTDTNILVVSTSNFACNVISKRLLEFLPSTEIFRLFSKSQEVVVDKIDASVLNVANFKDKKHYYPKPTELYPYRIIITTPTASGHLILDGFDCGHFTHLFVDECASCTEGSTLIPIAGLISSLNKISANIVLAGDPLQLSPMIHSKYANELGYGVSMIERLMNFSLYKPDQQTGDYDTNFITKLRLNYRSHKVIIHISNQLFYNNELQALGPKDITDWIIDWRYLPNPKFPLMFVACFGESMSENDSPSLYNKHEIKVVISYLNLLVNKNINGKVVRQTDIGVITPYRKQNQKIRSQFGGRWNGVEVASIEAFQGNEKSVIILSTVRSNVHSMGFLSNERRLNVALTRAQGMLIIIGDPKVLMRDKCWYQLMKFCYDNNAICGEPFNFYD